MQESERRHTANWNSPTLQLLLCLKGLVLLELNAQCAFGIRLHLDAYIVFGCHADCIGIEDWVMPNIYCGPWFCLRSGCQFFWRLRVEVVWLVLSCYIWADAYVVLLPVRRPNDFVLECITFFFANQHPIKIFWLHPAFIRAWKLSMWMDAPLSPITFNRPGYGRNMRRQTVRFGVPCEGCFCLHCAVSLKGASMHKNQIDCVRGLSADLIRHS